MRRHQRPASRASVKRSAPTLPLRWGDALSEHCAERDLADHALLYVHAAQAVLAGDPCAPRDRARLRRLDRHERFSLRLLVPVTGAQSVRRGEAVAARKRTRRPSWIASHKRKVACFEHCVHRPRLPIEEKAPACLLDRTGRHGVFDQSVLVFEPGLQRGRSGCCGGDARAQQPTRGRARVRHRSDR